MSITFNRSSTLSPLKFNKTLLYSVNTSIYVDSLESAVRVRLVTAIKKIELLPASLDQLPVKFFVAIALAPKAIAPPITAALVARVGACCANLIPPARAVVIITPSTG